VLRCVRRHTSCTVATPKTTAMHNRPCPGERAAAVVTALKCTYGSQCWQHVPVKPLAIHLSLACPQQSTEPGSLRLHALHFQCVAPTSSTTLATDLATAGVPWSALSATLLLFMLFCSRGSLLCYTGRRTEAGVIPARPTQGQKCYFYVVAAGVPGCAGH
jgi:hypothetical protein